MLLQIHTIDSELVIDSRLVAERLGVNHSDWIQNTVKTYQTEIEQAFGSLRFQNGALLMSDGRINPNPEKFAWLTEDQATVLMTLSRNTQQVVELKIQLVKAFSEAKKLLNGHKPLGKPDPAILGYYDLCLKVETRKRFTYDSTHDLRCTIAGLTRYLNASLFHPEYADKYIPRTALESSEYFKHYLTHPRIKKALTILENEYCRDTNDLPFLYRTHT